ncbi:hypothetical protein BKA80DRAFT_106063 [Phyllosticta citrichinensis]
MWTHREQCFFLPSFPPSLAAFFAVFSLGLSDCLSVYLPSCHCSVFTDGEMAWHAARSRRGLARVCGCVVDQTGRQADKRTDFPSSSRSSSSSSWNGRAAWNAPRGKSPEWTSRATNGICRHITNA